MVPPPGRTGAELLRRRAADSDARRAKNKLQKIIIQGLIDLEVNKDLKDKSGYTPLDLAYDNENHEINDLLTDNFCKRSKFPLKEYPKYKCDLFPNETYNRDQPPLPAVLFSSSSSNGTNSPQLTPRGEVVGFDLHTTTPYSTPSKQGI